MKKRLIVVTFLITTFLIGGCGPKKEPEIDPRSFDTIKERLQHLDCVNKVRSYGGNDYFRSVYSVEFKQYIDHNNKALGTFTQTVELGFNGFDKTNVYVSSGYMISDNNSYYPGENELAFLLNCNYVFVEHRYFNKSLPVDIDYSTNTTWQYLTTEQAASDAHEIVTQFKRILDGKWLSTGASKGGMTTELYAYYYPGDMDLYVPYVAPMCESFADTRMIKFIYEEAGNDRYGETKAAQMRNDILSFQLKMLEWRDTLAPQFYQYGLDSHAVYSNYLTQDNLYDSCVLEFAIGYWQYYQNASTITRCLNMAESNATELRNKQNAFFSEFVSVTSPGDVSLNNAFTPYYIQAYQELGNYGYDFSYIRNALPEGVTLTVTEQQEADLMWKLVLNENQLALPRKEIMEPKISNMLATTNDQFIILYGSSDPWYSVRPQDVERDNISIYVDTKHTHDTSVSNFPKSVREEILGKIKTILEIE